MTTSHAALRRGTPLLLSLALTFALAACSSADPSVSEGPNTGGGTIAVVDGEVALSANDLAFDASTIQAQAGEDFTITFTNNESDQHNVAVYTEEGGDLIGATDVIGGPDATSEVVIEGLEPGTYYFRCDIHPDMEGTIVVEG